MSDIPLRLLFSGASGFLGSTLCKKVADDPNWHSVALLRSTSVALEYDRVQQVRVEDLSDPEEIKTALGSFIPDRIVHAAALSSPLACERNPAEADRANRLVTAALCDLAEQWRVPITFISTDLVFDGARAPAGGFTESDTPSPLSVYARSKYAGEQRVLDLHQLGAIVRLALVYGRSLSSSLGVIGWMNQALRQGQPLTLFNDEYRTPIYLDDACDMILQIARSSACGVWHAGGRERLSRVEFGRSFCSVIGGDSRLIVSASRLTSPSDVQRPEDVSLNSQKFLTEFGFGPGSVLDSLELLAPLL
jgi:dTDP-4-dehydrorhamnose reductase